MNNNFKFWVKFISSYEAVPYKYLRFSLRMSERCVCMYTQLPFGFMYASRKQKDTERFYGCWVENFKTNNREPPWTPAEWTR